MTGTKASPTSTTLPSVSVIFLSYTEKIRQQILKIRLKSLPVTYHQFLTYCHPITRSCQRAHSELLTVQRIKIK